MTLLTPIGLLGLLGIVALIIIYIIRPNFQQKFISSTYIWKLSLKYGKKKIPINKLRNFLLILCQVLILAGSAMILTQPNKVLKEEIKEPEIIAILDSSASMRTELNGKSRFDRAFEKMQKKAMEIFAQSGIVSVILADNKPTYLQQRVTAAEQGTFETTMFEWYDENTCSFSTADIDGAISLCEEVIIQNPDAQIYLYTDTNYDYVPKGITPVNVSLGEEWNASILDATSRFESPYYSFLVEVACYGRDMEMEVELEITGVNATNSEDKKAPTYKTSVYATCLGDKPVQVLFVSNEYNEKEKPDEFAEYKKRIEASYPVVCWMNDTKTHSYISVNVSISQDDSFKVDNSFELYDGLREVIKVQYASEKPNVFWPAALAQLTKSYEGAWDIDVDEVKKGDEPELQGYDLYIFEHKIPEELPEDGVVVVVNPDALATKYGVRLGSVFSTKLPGISPEATEVHPIRQNIALDRIYVTRFTQIILDASYETVFGYKEYPWLAVRNDETAKIVVMPFSLHYSTIAVTEIFPLLVYNIFDYFFPQTVQSSSFEVGERVELNARGEELMVEGAGFEQTFDEFPAYITVNTPGAYTMTQTVFNGKEVIERIFVQIPKQECNIKRTEEALAEPYAVSDDSIFLQDLLIYLAASVVLLLFIEWWLKGRDSV